MSGARLLVLFLLSSCATRVMTNGGKLLSPEAQGETIRGSLNLASSYASSYKMSFGNNEARGPLVHENSGRQVGIASELGIVGPVDLIASLGSETIFGLKWQFLGEPRISAKALSYSAALVGTISSAEKTANVDDDESENIPANARDVEFKQKGRTVGVLGGVRVLDPLLLYIGYYKITEEIDGKVTTLDYTLNGAPFSYSNKGNLTSMGLIYYSATNLVTKLELSSLDTKWSNSKSRSDSGWSVALGLVW